MVQMMVSGRPASQGTEWVSSLWGLFIGTCMAMVALVMGQHAALAICMALTQHGMEKEPPADVSMVPTEGETLRTSAAEEVHVGLGPPNGGGPHDMALHVRIPMEAAAHATMHTTTESLPRNDMGDNCTNATQQQQQNPTTKQMGPQSNKLETALEAQKQSRQQQQQPQQQTTVQHSHHKHPYPWQALAADVTALAILVTITSTSLAYSIKDTATPHSSGRRYFWFSLLFGPVGTLLRWQLARLNTNEAVKQLLGSFSWLPLGTLVANLGACLLDFVMALLQVSKLLSMLYVIRLCQSPVPHVIMHMIACPS